jgi:outer membrane receptor for ferric coprogen and ferric-rhodotorulic acid
MNCTNYHPIKPITTTVIDFDYVDYDDYNNHIDFSNNHNNNNKSEENIDIIKIVDFYLLDESNNNNDICDDNKIIQDIDEIDISNIWQFDIVSKNAILSMGTQKQKIYNKYENVYTPSNNIMKIYQTNKIIETFKLKKD